MHIPVLLQEVIKYLEPKPGEKFIDATIGSGGHARQLLLAGAAVLGIDRDLEAIARLRSEFSALGGSPPKADAPREHAFGGKIQESKGKIVLVQANFSNLEQIARAHGFSEVDGILFDLGMSSMQLDDARRGFAFQNHGPLDMRFDQITQRRTAADLVNRLPEKDLAEIFYDFAEEKRFGKKIARAIVEVRKSRNLETTTELFDLIKKALPGKIRYRAGGVARKIFQGLRIAVNEELANLEKALPQALKLLRIHGGLVVISFHSLEDRIVKKFLAEGAKSCICPSSFPVCRCKAQANLRILTKKPIVPSQEEIKTNPRCCSAKLRAAEKINHH